MVIIASDHAGFKYKNKIKEHLENNNIPVKDLGPSVLDPLDSYTTFAVKACEEFLITKEKNKFLILICGSGVGMSVCANRYKNIRAVNAVSVKQAKLARQHNNANCLCLGARLTSLMKTKKIVKIFLNEKFLAGKHEKRVKELCKIGD